MTRVKTIIVILQLSVSSLIMADQIQSPSGLNLSIFIGPSICELARFAEPPCYLHGQVLQRRDDYTYTPGIGGHKLHTRAVPWDDARLTCEEEGGHLAIINSIAEANVLAEVFKNAEPITGSRNPDYASIGIHDHYREGHFVTVHGQSLARAGYTAFIGGQPDNSGGAENCGSFHKSGRFNDIRCEKPYGFICEIPYTN